MQAVVGLLQYFFELVNIGRVLHFRGNQQCILLNALHLRLWNNTAVGVKSKDMFVEGMQAVEVKAYHQLVYSPSEWLFQGIQLGWAGDVGIRFTREWSWCT